MFSQGADTVPGALSLSRLLDAIESPADLAAYSTHLDPLNHDPD